MKYALLAAALVSSCAFSQTAERPNMPVFRSGPWFVVRSVRPGDVVACTGFYRANGRVQLSKDMLVIKTAEEVKGVSFGYDDQPMGAQRALTAGEKELKAIAFSGDDFAKLRTSHKVRIAVATPQGTMHHEFDLNGLPAALENINAGCPVPHDKPIRRRHRS